MNLEFKWQLVKLVIMAQSLQLPYYCRGPDTKGTEYIVGDAQGDVILPESL